MRAWARLAAKQSRDAYLYVFSHPAPLPVVGRTLGALHASETPYIFAAKSVEWDDSDVRLSDMMRRYWINFARTGNPNGEGLVQWPSYDQQTDELLELKLTPEVRRHYRKQRLDAYEGYIENLRALNATSK